MNNKKSLLFFSIIAIIISSLALSVFADEVPTLTIARNSLELKNAVFMNFKVQSENVTDTSDIELLVWNEPQGEYVKGTESASLSSIRTEEDTGYHVFQYNDISAKEMTDTIYVCAYANIDSLDIYSKPVKFSIFQYAYNNLNSSSASEELKSLLTFMLEYGASAQIYFDYNTDFLATDEVAKVKVVNGKHSDGFSTGYFKAGAEITISANEPDEGYEFACWKDVNENIVSTDSVFVISECETNTYTAEYSEKTLSDDSFDDETTEDEHFDTVYRYREKEYTSSKTELDSPWIEYETKTEYSHGSYNYVYIRAYQTNGTGTSSGYTASQADSWKTNNSSKYCFHSEKTYVYRYDRKTGYNTGSETLYVTSSGSVDLTKYWYTGLDYWRFRVCSGKTPYLVHYYYKWGEWSDWSNSPIDATDDIEVETKQVAHEHDYSCIVTYPTCTTEGYSTYTCSSCGNSYVGEYTDALGHSFGDWQIITEATCDTNGEKRRQCTVCDAEETVELDALGHSYIKVIIEPTCTQKGYIEYTCEYCQDNHINDYTDLIEHSYTEGYCLSCGKPLDYLVIYELNCSEEQETFMTQSKIHDIPLQLTNEIPTRSEYIFAGWSTNKNGEVEYVPGDMYNINDTIVFYAIWNKQITTIDKGTFGNDLYWELTSDGTLNISGEGEMFTYYWEWEEYGTDGFPWHEHRDIINNVFIEDGITSVGYMAFDKCTKITQVHLPNSIVTIDSFAFRDCENLTNIILPNALKEIGFCAFYYCEKLTSIVIPNSVTSLDEKAFANCTRLINVSLSENLVCIGNSAFYYCENLKQITIPNSVTIIGDYAFCGCDSLEKIQITENVTNIGERAFSNCDNLTQILVHNDNPYYENDDFGVLFNKNKTELIQYPKGNNSTLYSIPGSVTSIHNGAFYWCSNLSEIIIPDSVIEIGDYAFSYCDGLKEITIPTSVKSIGESAFNYCKYLTVITIPGNVSSIEKNAFYSCKNLKNVVILNGVTDIGSYAFAWCENLTTIIIPRSVSNIEKYAFSQCKKLTIQGESGSYAETYASENGIAFESLETTTENTVT